MMTERKRALERYRKHAREKIMYMRYSSEFYKEYKHELRPVRSPRWIRYRTILHDGYFDLRDYVVIDRRPEIASVCIAPKWMSFLILLKVVGNAYGGAIHGIGWYLESIGFLSLDRGCYPSIKWLIDGRRRAKKKASQ